MSTAGNVERALLAQLQAGHTTETSPLLARVLRNNRIVLHNYRAATLKDFRCDLEGCGRAFPIMLLPNQTLYPRYCSAHRTEHRRTLHRERLSAPSVPSA